MTIVDFTEILRQIINEFRILNEHFNNQNRSTTEDYDQISANWVRDMLKRFKNIPLNLHWATSSPHILKNQLLFDIRYTDEYFCELKYKFDETLIRGFVDSIKNILTDFQIVIKSFIAFNDTFDIDNKPATQDYEKEFSDWKKYIGNIAPNVTLDYHWGNKMESLLLNPIYLTVMFADDCLFEVKYFFKKSGGTNPSGSD
jgi:hypothetical protein